MDIYTKFLNHFDYDVRKTRDARWIDQKCTYDVMSIISDCILEYVDSTSITEFTVSDIWHSNYARENVIEIFSELLAVKLFFLIISSANFLLFLSKKFGKLILSEVLIRTYLS